MAHIKLIPVNHLNEQMELEEGRTYRVTEVVSVRLTHAGTIDLQDEVEMCIRVIE